MLNEINKKVKKGNHLALDFTRTKILSMAKSLTEPELKPYNTNELLNTKS
jgi:hypothetical protein